MRINEPHGYLRDDDGLVVLRFANWEIGEHSVPDAVASVDYVEGANAHSEDVADKYQSQIRLRNRDGSTDAWR